MFLKTFQGRAVQYLANKYYFLIATTLSNIFIFFFPKHNDNQYFKSFSFLKQNFPQKEDIPFLFYLSS